MQLSILIDFMMDAVVQEMAKGKQYNQGCLKGAEVLRALNEFTFPPNECPLTGLQSERERISTERSADAGARAKYTSLEL